MATKIVYEIDTFSTFTYFLIGLLTLVISLSLFFLSKNINSNKSYNIQSSFNYVEGLNTGSGVVISGIKVGEVDKIMLLEDKVIVQASIKNKYLIPADSIFAVRSNGIFGKKSLLIEPGFDDMINDDNYVFTNTKDSYSIDMFLRYLNDLNE